MKKMRKISALLAAVVTVSCMGAMNAFAKGEMKKKIVLASIEELKEFNDAANDCPFEVTVTQGKYCVDGKSIMGMFSLNLTSPVTVEYDSDDNEHFESVLRKYKAD